MSNNLDSNQILIKVYDQLNNRLRTDASLSSSNINISVDISEEDDSIVVYGNDGSNNKVIKTDTHGRIEFANPNTTIVNKFRHDYNVTNVTTSSYVEVLNATSGNIKSIEIYDSSNQTLVVGFGPSGSEVEQFYIIPGGNGIMKYYIPSGTRIAIKAVGNNATNGVLVVNLYNN